MRLLFYGEIVLMLILGAACALFTVTGFVGLATAGGGDSLHDALADLVEACICAYLCNVLWSDIRRQRRRIADPPAQGSQGHTK